ncbi:immunoglobulin domain-containing protein [Microbacterium sp. No. 7]|uniref:immunoglobulin domain-containing protein n=1 Tax=Microbacterium sp. No. 7 TaxID=1714373 RepID=UPI0012E0D25F|nr:immunoglobulin domain-containing protein [Microbacterium sp. No. 7]
MRAPLALLVAALLALGGAVPAAAAAPAAGLVSASSGDPFAEETAGEDPFDEAPAAPAEEEPAEEEPVPGPVVMVANPLAGDPGTSVDNGDGTSTYTYWDDETVTYPNVVVPGEPIRLTGAGWLTVPGHPQVDEGDEGSVIGVKFMPASGSVIRIERVPNPRTGEADYSSNDVWDIAQAAGTGEWWGGATPGTWQIDIPWPTADLAQNPPTLQAGDRFTLQVLSGTLYSNEVCSGGCERPDVSRTIPLSLTVVDETTEPDHVAPSFTGQPADVTVTEGQDAVFSVAAAGYPRPDMQWEITDGPGGEWLVITDVTGPTLTIPAASLERSGSHVRAVATNAAGSAESRAALLTVQPAPTRVAPVVTTQPQDVTIREGESATLTAAATGDPAPTVRWESAPAGEAWAPIAGATSGILTLHNLTPAHSGTRYRAVFTNEAGSATSDVATVTVGAGEATPVAITTHPASQSIESGEPVTFTAAASGVPAPAVRWQRSTDSGATWQDVRGAESASLTIEAVAESESGHRFRAVFTNTASPNGVATNAATLTVTPRENIREFCGTSYGPGAVNSGIPFCFRGPEKVVEGEPIVIEGVSGYLATDDVTGSVVNFFLDAEYSGDPNTVYSKRTFTNLATGEQISDRRTHAIVQANRDGTWRVEIPWPTVSTVSPSSDGQASYTAQELAEKFAPGTKHSFRMLTGSLMNTPPDRQRGGSLYFTVVESLDDTVTVTEPLYEHQTFRSTVAGDQAVAWLQQQVSSGQSMGLSGTGWLTKDKQWGSSITVRLQNEDGEYYQRSGGTGGSTGSGVWQTIQASERGEFDVRVDLPAGVKAGDFVAVELTTVDDGSALGDVARRWVSEPVVIDKEPYVKGPGEGATCTAKPGAASYQLAPGMDKPAANVGGSIRLTGKDWCNLVGGGSLIAIKIDDGAYSRLPSDTAPIFDANRGQEVGKCPATICATNKTIWYVIEAKSDGSFDVDIPIPTRTNTDPAFEEGAYTLRIMTRTLAADPYYKGERLDPSRTMKSPEFTVVAEGESLTDVAAGKPKAPPKPPHATQDLSDAARGGVTVEQRQNDWLVTVPGAAEGDWVYANVFDGASPRSPWGAEWFEVDANRQFTLPLAGATIPAGENKLSVQDRTGAVLGWAWVTVAEPPSTESPQGGGTSTTGTTGSTSSANRTTSGGTSAGSGTAMSAVQSKARPVTTPPQPVAAFADLTRANAGGVTGVEKDGKIVVTLPGAAGGDWVFLYLYTSTGQVLPVDWVQVGSDRTLTVDIGTLPAGTHKLAFVGADGTLVGWVTANGKQAAVAGATPGGADAAGAVGGALGAVSSNDDTTMTLVMSGIAVLVLAAAAAGAITIRRRTAVA